MEPLGLNGTFYGSAGFHISQRVSANDAALRIISVLCLQLKINKSTYYVFKDVIVQLREEVL